MKRRGWTLPLVGLALLAAGTAAAGPREVRAALDQSVPGLLTSAKVPSVSIAVIEDGKVALTTAYGEQSPGVRATPATLYNIASLTKPVTAEVVLRLASRKIVSLDAPMADYWTDPDIANDDRRLALTPRLALSHQTGFPNWRGQGKPLAFQFTPGTSYGYSGEGYQYVARYVEKKTGQDFESLAQVVLFRPAGMNDTASGRKPWFDGRVAVPTDAAGKALEPGFASGYNAADLLYTTAGDYARFIVGVLKDQDLTAAVAADRRHIQVSQMAEMCAGAKAASCPVNAGFGLGWQVLEFNGETVMMHTGRDEGVSTFAWYSPTTRQGAVFLTNSDNGFQLVLPVFETLGASPAFMAYLRGQS
ncbi:serine hydrolase domain-containing protein [Nitrospirillum iridis]|uniref:CubicO group peptidase (Beta-lactamase class C family) n=1 Tax=Nitrospirillum iridis TaxID=765888 RepID=A0A7X0EDF4_9PROT|nr:serine hydrolase domain-containing protein [Nitrospirillum iridis]MBB6250319.1 CubicO group peptidase (beta-lactamase class C family) [Nitrospirillum iridis]